MATLTIRNIDDETKRLLRQRAARHEHSMEEEARQILRRPWRGIRPGAGRWAICWSSFRVPGSSCRTAATASRMSRSRCDSARYQCRFGTAEAQPRPRGRAMAEHPGGGGSLSPRHSRSRALLRLVDPAGRPPKTVSGDLIDRVVSQFEGRVVPFDLTAAVEYGRLMATARSAGVGLPILDGQVAAIARAQGAALATRNVKHFEQTGIPLLNPWEDTR